LRAPSLPHEFSDAGPILDIIEACAACAESRTFADFWGMTTDLNSSHFEKQLATIGTYGKVATTKQSFALVEALKELAEAGLPFNFVVVTSGTPQILRRYCDAIRDSPLLAKRTWVLPPIAPWRIPDFIRTCDAICFLEHGFPIDFHMPRIPREVLACGVCLVCSSEIALKQVFHRSLVSGKNFVCVDDPTCRTALKAALDSVISDGATRSSISRHGFLLSQVIETSLVEVDPICDLIPQLMAEEQDRRA
jgi:hypothetical protein